MLAELSEIMPNKKPPTSKNRPVRQGPGSAGSRFGGEHASYLVLPQPLFLTMTMFTCAAEEASDVDGWLALEGVPKQDKNTNTKADAPKPTGIDTSKAPQQCSEGDDGDDVVIIKESTAAAPVNGIKRGRKIRGSGLTRLVCKLNRALPN